MMFNEKTIDFFMEEENDEIDAYLSRNGFAPGVELRQLWRKLFALYENDGFFDESKVRRIVRGWVVNAESEKLCQKMKI